MTAIAKAQTTDPALLQNIQKASQAQIDAYVAADLEEGMLVYNTDENRIYEYTDTGFQEILLAGNVHVGQFIISATGPQTVTGLPFKPNKITFRALPNIESATIDAANDSGDLNTGTRSNTFGTMNGYARTVGATVPQQVIFVGGSGSSINDITRYANAAQCIGIRYANADGDQLGYVRASLTSFNIDGFTLNVTDAADNLLVLYTAYR